MGGSLNKRFLMLFVCALLCALLMSGPALSEIQNLGNNLSRAVPGSHNTTMRICDGERDGKRAYARYYRKGLSYPFFILDTVGKDGRCVNEESNRRISHHQTCEVRGRSIGGGDDLCTAFSGH